VTPDDQTATSPDRRALINLRTWSSMLGLLVAILAGCAKPADERSAVVSGQVTVAGAALQAGTVLFMTDDGHAASDDLAPDGRYTVRCRPGNYKVAVTPPPPIDPLATPASAAASQNKLDSSPIPKRYQELAKSGLTVDARAGNNNFDISLTP
jgi:hypothetical protein